MSSYRRTGRFLLPSGFAMVFGWVLCELGLFKIARVSVAGWLVDTTHPQDDNLWTALRALRDSTLTLWLQAEYPFEPSYWALFFLLKGSFIMFTVLLATICTRSRYRMLIMVLTYLFYWVGNDGKYNQPTPPEILTNQTPQPWLASASSAALS
jgi:hypothetical protein